MIQSKYTREEFDIKLSKLLEGHELRNVHPNILNDKISVLQDYTSEQFESLLKGIEEGKLSSPNSWIQAILTLDENRGIVFMGKEQNTWSEPGRYEITKKKTSLLDINKLILIATLVVSILGVIPLYQIYFEDKKIINLELKNLVEVININENIEGLKITYNDKEINNLIKISYRLSNSGSLEIQSDSVKIFPTIDFKTTKILALNIKRKHPAQVKAKLQEKEGKVSLVFDDIKTNEYIDFEVYISGKVDNPLNAYLRIDGVNKLTILGLDKYVAEKEANDNKINSDFLHKHGWLIIILWVLFLFMLLILIAMVSTYRQKKKIRKKIKAGFSIESLSRDDLRLFISDDMSYLTTGDSTALMKIIDEENSDNLIKATTIIQQDISNKNDIHGIIFVIFPICIGLLYVLVDYYFALNWLQ